MSYRVFFWNVTDPKLSLGTADVDDVPAVGDTVTINGAASQQKVSVRSRHFFVSNLDDPPPPPKGGQPPPRSRVDLLVEVI